MLHLHIIKTQILKNLDILEITKIYDGIIYYFLKILRISTLCPMLKLNFGH